MNEWYEQAKRKLEAQQARVKPRSPPVDGGGAAEGHLPHGA